MCSSHTTIITTVINLLLLLVSVDQNWRKYGQDIGKIMAASTLIIGCLSWITKDAAFLQWNNRIKIHSAYKRSSYMKAPYWRDYISK